MTESRKDLLYSHWQFLESIYGTADSRKDALEAKFGVSDAGSELYVMEQFYDYKMVDDRSVVEQAHEIQMLVLATFLTSRQARSQHLNALR